MDGNKDQNNILSIEIPKEILFNPFITRTEKELFGHLRILSASFDGCSLSNRDLGIRLNVTPQSISNGIAKLKKYKYIKTTYTRKRAGTNESIRHIHVDQTYHERYGVLIPLWEEMYARDNAAGDQIERDFIKKITKKCKNGEDKWIIKTLVKDYVNRLRNFQHGTL